MKKFKYFIIFILFISFSCASESEHIQQPISPSFNSIDSGQNSNKITQKELSKVNTSNNIQKDSNITKEINKTEIIKEEKTNVEEKDLTIITEDDKKTFLLEVEEKNIKVGNLTNGIFIEKEGNEFLVGENFVISASIKGLKVIDEKIKYNQDVILYRDNKEILKKENIFGNTGNVLETGDLSGTSSILLNTNLQLNSSFKGNIIAKIKVKDMYNNLGFVIFTAKFSIK